MLHTVLLVPELYFYSGRNTIATAHKVERHINYRVQLTRAFLPSHLEAVNEQLAAAPKAPCAVPAATAAALPNGSGNARAEAVKNAAEAPLEHAVVARGHALLPDWRAHGYPQRAPARLRALFLRHALHRQCSMLICELRRSHPPN